MYLWKVTDLAVCIDDNWKKGKEIEKYIKDWPVKGCIYTIRGIVDRYIPRLKENRLGFLFEEILNPEIDFCDNYNFIERLEPAYEAIRFRPVKKTSLDCFNYILNPDSEKKTKKTLEDA